MPDFDPYHQWLGIPPDERPISKYRLLGIAEFERDKEIINSASLRQTKHLRTMQAGEHESLVAQLLNEISSARVTLLDPEQKSAYDAQLRIERKPKEAESETIATPIVQPAAPAVSLPTPPASRLHNVATPRNQTVAEPIWKRKEVIALSAAGCLLILILLFMLGGSNDAPVAEPGPSPKATTKPTRSFDELKTLTGHSRRVRSVAFSPDGKTIASGSEDNTIKLWDSETGDELKTLTGHSNYVESVGFSPDGKTIASGSPDGTIKLWDSETGDELRTLTGHNGFVVSVAFSSDGAMIASGNSGYSIKLWDSETGDELKTLTGHNGWVVSVAFSPDGKTIASGSWDDSIKLWDSETGVELKTLMGHTLDVNTVAFSPDGKTIASGSSDKSIKLWDSETGDELRTLTGHNGFVASVAFSPDGKMIASGSSDNSIKLWDSETLDELKTLTGHPDYVTSVAFSPDGRMIASGSWDDTVKIWGDRTLRKSSSQSEPVASSTPQTEPEVPTKAAKKWVELRASVEEQGLVAYYPFSGNAEDESGNENHGEVSGATLGPDRRDLPDTAYYFDGLDDRIIINSEKLQLFGSRAGSTVSFWLFKRTDAHAYILTKGFHGNAQSGGNRYLQIEVDALGAPQFSLYQNSLGNGTWAVAVKDQIPAKKWVHVVCVRGLQSKVYVNGTDITDYSNEWTNRNTDTNWDVDYNDSLGAQPICLGALQSVGNLPYSKYFSGALDNIRIYNRALSAEEVQWLYDHYR